MRALVIIAALLLAAPAQAKTIGLIGDSHVCGGTQFTGLGDYVSQWNPGNTIRAILAKATGTWAAATVQNWCVPGTSQEDWLPPGPSAAAYCTATNTPWDCCTGSGTGTSCICDGALVNRYPQLKAACRDRAPMTNYLPLVDRWILIPDGWPHDGGSHTSTQVENAVDDIESLAVELDTIDGGDGVVVTSPVRFSGDCILGAIYDDVYDEMVLRGDVITAGYDLYDLPALTRCPDLIHPTDGGYVTVGSGIAGPLL